MTLQSIVVPLDGSPFGEFALPYALSLARRAGAKIEMIHVYQLPETTERSLVTALRDDHQAAEQARHYLTEVAQRLRAAAPGLDITATLVQGRISEAICDHLTTTSPSLAVLTTHGRGPLSRFWLGSVATDLMQRSPVPLLLVRPSDHPPDWTADVAPQRILLPLDGSPFSEQILPLAIAIGTLTHATYRLLEVVPPAVPVGGDGLTLYSPPSPAVVQEWACEAQTYLHSVRSRYPALHGAETYVAAGWPTATTILTDAADHRIDLIALATHGRSGIVKFLLGSVADKVVRGAGVPVLLSRPTAS
ncbi:MAG: universal stress protein [Gemmataceae bacterium]|nr:universal stress protein [Gemmata sp.]MDW8198205.1 universal stress protein [Gemmataceae bacterium]